MSRAPLISILTPALNCSRYIRDCIESVLAQSYEPFEHIIVDGGSRDGTVEILKQYPHLRWISEPDRGEGDALNKALRMARGDILAWLNADDFYLPGAFDAVLRVIDPARERHVVYGKANEVNTSGSVLVAMAAPPRSLKLKVPRMLQWFRPYDIYQCSLFFTRAVLEDVGPFRADLVYSIDFDYWVRIALKGHRFHFIDRVLAHARMERPNAKSRATPFEQMARIWLRVSMSFLDRVTLWERIVFWIFYGVYWSRGLLAQRLPVPVRLVIPMLRVMDRILGKPSDASGAADDGPCGVVDS